MSEATPMNWTASDQNAPINLDYGGRVNMTPTSPEPILAFPQNYQQVHPFPQAPQQYIQQVQVAQPGQQQASQQFMQQVQQQNYQQVQQPGQVSLPPGQVVLPPGHNYSQVPLEQYSQQPGGRNYQQVQPGQPNYQQVQPGQQSSLPTASADPSSLFSRPAPAPATATPNPNNNIATPAFYDPFSDPNSPLYGGRVMPTYNPHYSFSAADLPTPSPTPSQPTPGTGAVAVPPPPNPTTPQSAPVFDAYGGRMPARPPPDIASSSPSPNVVTLTPSGAVSNTHGGRQPARIFPDFVAPAAPVHTAQAQPYTPGPAFEEYYRNYLEGNFQLGPQNVQVAQAAPAPQKSQPSVVQRAFHTFF